MHMDTSRSAELASPPLARKIVAAVLARFNQARLGFPRRILIGAGGIGDDLLCTAVFHELKKRREGRMGMMSANASLFENNPDVDFVFAPRSPAIARILQHGLPVTPLSYSAYDPVQDRDEPLKEHVLATLCRKAGITGEVELRPWLHLRPEELAAGRHFERQIAIQSSALGSPHPMKNKDWSPGKFQSLARRLREAASLVQLGSPSDPPLEGALDLRGKTSLRGSAAVLANSLIFAGNVGLLMHLARAVDCRSVIVYGGRETPDLTGYPANANLTGPTPCSPCWLRNTCPYDLECMRMIKPESAWEAAQAQIARHGTPLETASAIL